MAASDVTNAMMAVKIELEEKKRTADLLQRALVCVYSYNMDWGCYYSTRLASESAGLCI